MLSLPQVPLMGSDVLPSGLVPLHYVIVITLKSNHFLAMVLIVSQNSQTTFTSACSLYNIVKHLVNH